MLILITEIQGDLRSSLNFHIFKLKPAGGNDRSLFTNGQNIKLSFHQNLNISRSPKINSTIVMYDFPANK